MKRLTIVLIALCVVLLLPATAQAGWHRVISLSGDNGFADTAGSNNAPGWAIDEAGRIWKTADCGETWKKMNFHFQYLDPVQVESRGLNVWVLCNGWGFGYADDARLLVSSTNGGNSWTIAQTTLDRLWPVDLFGISPATAPWGTAHVTDFAAWPDGHYRYLVQNDAYNWTLYSSADGGATWSTIRGKSQYAAPGIAFPTAGHGWVSDGLSLIGVGTGIRPGDPLPIPGKIGAAGDHIWTIGEQLWVWYPE